MQMYYADGHKTKHENAIKILIIIYIRNYELIYEKQL